MARGRDQTPYLPVPVCNMADLHHQLEKAFGTRPQLQADINVDVPVYNAMSDQLAAQWPRLNIELVEGIRCPPQP
jgi:hypothetical protein